MAAVEFQRREKLVRGVYSRTEKQISIKLAKRVDIRSDIEVTGAHPYDLLAILAWALWDNIGTFRNRRRK
jgi:hypothetical protein